MNPLQVQKMRGCKAEWDEIVGVERKATFTQVAQGGGGRG